MDVALLEAKNALRAQMRGRLAALDPDERRARSERIVATLREQPAWGSARRVLLFAPLPAEPDVDALWLGDALAGKECAYPRVTGTTMRPYFVEGVAELAPTRWGLREPVPTAVREADVADFDLVLVPGLAFDRAGGRLGRGGGFYDRLLAARSKRTRLLGVGFGFQLVEALPLAPHDVRLDGVCTDEGMVTR